MIKALLNKYFTTKEIVIEDKKQTDNEQTDKEIIIDILRFKIRMLEISNSWQVLWFEPSFLAELHNNPNSFNDFVEYIKNCVISAEKVYKTKIDACEKRKISLSGYDYDYDKNDFFKDVIEEQKAHERFFLSRKNFICKIIMDIALDKHFGVGR